MENLKENLMSVFNLTEEQYEKAFKLDGRGLIIWFVPYDNSGAPISNESVVKSCELLTSFKLKDGGYNTCRYKGSIKYIEETIKELIIEK